MLWFSVVRAGLCPRPTIVSTLFWRRRSYRPRGQDEGGNPVPQSLGLLGGDAELIRHTHQIDQRPGLHLSHDLASMDLHRCLAQLKLSCNLLVRASGDDEREDFPFARSQDIKAILQACDESELLALSSIMLDPCLDCIE